MDSVTQVLLGASVGVAVMGRRTALWKSALWGGVAGLLPDLDVLIDHGDPILNMVRHRAESHALLLLALFAFPMAWMVSRLHGETRQLGRWWWALMLALVTHPLLDLMTIYGTRGVPALYRRGLRAGQPVHHRPGVHAAPTDCPGGDLGGGGAPHASGPRTDC